MTEERNHKAIAAAVVVLLAAVSLVGIAYAYSASYTLTDSSTENSFVTLTMTTGSDQPVGNNVLFTYEQGYDTYTDSGNNITYRLLADHKRIKLNTDSYKLIISGTDDDGTYSIKAAMPVLPTLYEDDSQQKPCKFVLVLKGTNTYEAELSAPGVTVFSNIGEGDGGLPLGTYTFDIYLELATTPSPHQGSDPCVAVSKAKFVDNFVTTNIDITFTAEPA